MICCPRKVQKDPIEKNTELGWGGFWRLPGPCSLEDLIRDHNLVFVGDGSDVLRGCELSKNAQPVGARAQNRPRSSDSVVKPQASKYTHTPLTHSLPHVLPQTGMFLH